MTLHYAGQPGQGYGWGTCNTHLRAELAKLVTLNEGTANVVFMPLADHDLNPATPARGEVNLAYTFFEFELGPNAAANAAKYDVVFAGSTWCLDRLAERGIHNTELLIQGVDGETFKAKPPRKTEHYKAGVAHGKGMKLSLYADPKPGFRIFSGGKFEYRKGQDLVIAAFREFAKTHPEAHLVCSWFNPWPQLIKQMPRGEHFTMPTFVGETPQEWMFEMMMKYNGIPRDRFTILPQLSHTDLAREMANTDVGLFPNRCEGGTNLVLMEYAALGRPVISNVLTGHADVAWAIHHRIVADKNPETHWAEQTIRAITNEMEMAKMMCVPGIEVNEPPRWPWSDAAEKIVTTARKYFARLK
jgi:glycosyltransferase involved in cell wall biosynthesis